MLNIKSSGECDTVYFQAVDYFMIFFGVADVVADVQSRVVWFHFIDGGL